ncbi:alpha/beta fold hydrolase [Alteromonas sp. RKMC-009]|uniref:alpha/beta fold hydrolase n=1 Tax=Alteromonas sp. RKMC-009 TaxID=2267264 RepID=UPI000E6799FB|nr:alpha/beta hydrolase [Alteromonas sp. RKMC-009]AYA63531.1 alpha/beta hydrolase [Alteromonas sp. RKMC-009]
MPYLNVKNARVYYDVCGEGPELVFVHGAGANSLVFFRQVQYFSQKYRVICMDMRGFGHSICEPGTFHQRDLPDDLCRVLDAEATGPVNIVCQSMGAWAGLPLAVREPDRVNALVLSGSPTPAYGPHHAALQNVSRTFKRAGAGETVAPTQLGFTEEFVNKYPELITLYQMLARQNQQVDTSHITDEELRLMPDDFSEYSVPTLVMGGMKNKLLGGETHKIAAQHIPGAEVYTFPESGHSSYFEEPDHYNQVVDEFFARFPLGREDVK